MGKNRSVSRIGPELSRWGNRSRGPIPPIGATESEEKHFRLRVKQLICGSLNGMRIRQSLLQPYISQTRMQVPWKVQQLEAGVWGLWSNPRVRAAVDCGGMIKGMWGRRLWWEMPVEESRAAMEARRYCWVTCRGWIHHPGLSPHMPALAAEQ